jgi:hypothetical protein
MLAILHSLGMFIADLFKARGRLEAENLLLRHQLNLALRQASSRPRLRGNDRALLVWVVRLWPSLLDAVQVVSARNNSSLASRWISKLLAVEISE